MRRLGHRLRLTLVSGVTAGILLALVFAGIVFTSRASELQAAQDVLEPAVRQAEEEVRTGGSDPDLEEITAPNPELSIATFSPEGQLLAHAGPRHLRPETREGVIHTPQGPQIVIATGHAGGKLIVAALPWSGREKSTRRMAILLALLWGPLTACAALAIWRASHATFQPLAELARQAEAMSASPLARRLPEEGADEFATFAAQLNRFLDRLSESVSRQEQFVADAAHELRTPLAVLRGSIETTLRRNRTEAEYRETLTRTLVEAERLSDLVETLLQSAKPSTAPADPTDLEVAIEKAHARWVDRFANAEVILNTETEPLLAPIGETEVGVVLDNLLSNALRASPAGTHCRVNLSRTGDRARLTVEDEGVGIPEGHAAQIFERFARGDEGRDRDRGGFGIGLAVCRRLITERGGTIYAEPGTVGARFVIEFPLD